MRLKRERNAGHASEEIERRYRELMFSEAFLYAFLDSGGNFLLMNRGMQRLLGPEQGSLFACCAQKEALNRLLKDALLAPVSALLPLSLEGRGQAWIDAEFSPSALRDGPAIRLTGTDVTEWVQAVRQQPRQPLEVKAGDVLNALAIPAAVVGGDVCLAANAPFLGLLGGEAAGRRLKELIREDSPINVAFHKQLPLGTGPLECRLATQDGDVLWLRVNSRPLEWAGSPALLLTFEDISSLRRVQEQLSRLEGTDLATGIPNRQGMEKIVLQALERAIRERAPLGLMILDVDGFRRINERQGYAAAERLLKALASALEGGLSQREVLGRWGGDTFMVLTPRPDVRERAEALRAAALEAGLPVSVGAARLRDGMDVPAFVGAAYDALVRAKRSGGGCVALDGDLHGKDQDDQEGRMPDGADSDYRRGDDREREVNRCQPAGGAAGVQGDAGGVPGPP